MAQQVTNGPIKAAAYTAVFPIFDADGDLTNANGIVCKVSKDGGTAATSTNSAALITGTVGMYKLAMTATSMNADVVAIYVTATTTGVKPVPLVFYTAALLSVPTVAAIAASSAASVWAAGTKALTDKAGFTLTASYNAAKTAAPTIAAMTASMWAATTRALTDKAGFSLTASYDAAKSALTTKTGFSLTASYDSAKSVPTLTQIAASTWAYATRALTDKALFTLHSDYDAAKTAATATNLSTLQTTASNILRWFTNKRTVTTSEQVVYADNGTTPLYTQVLSDDDTTVTRNAAT